MTYDVVNSRQASWIFNICNTEAQTADDITENILGINFIFVRADKN